MNGVAGAFRYNQYMIYQDKRVYQSLNATNPDARLSIMKPVDSLIASNPFGIFTFINPVGQAVFFIVFLGIVLGILGFFFIIQSFSMKKSYKELKKLNEGFKDYDVH